MTCVSSNLHYPAPAATCGLQPVRGASCLAPACADQPRALAVADPGNTRRSLAQFGLDPASTRCAKVDGLQAPWCYYGDDDEWDFCDKSCDTAAGAPTPSCSITLTGKTCDAWGENDFGLDPASNECEQVDGLDRPWCYFGDEDDSWDYCDCTAGSSSPPSPPPKTSGDEDDALTVSDGASGKGTMTGKKVLAASAGDWQETDEVDDEGRPLQRIDMKTLMLQGKVTRWWWDSNFPSSTRLIDQNFDSEVLKYDYYVSLCILLMARGTS